MNRSNFREVTMQIKYVWRTHEALPLNIKALTVCGPSHSILSALFKRIMGWLCMLESHISFSIRVFVLNCLFPLPPYHPHTCMLFVFMRNTWTLVTNLVQVFYTSIHFDLFAFKTKLSTYMYINHNIKFETFKIFNNLLMVTILFLDDLISFYMQNVKYYVLYCAKIERLIMVGLNHNSVQIMVSDRMNKGAFIFRDLLMWIKVYTYICPVLFSFTGSWRYRSL